MTSRSKLTLVRFASTPSGTLGRLGSFYTLELPWKNNQRNVSCVPTGTYVCKRAFFHHGGYESFLLQDVPGRSGIFIHSAAAMQDIEGCIGLGLGLDAFMHEEYARIPAGTDQIGLVNGREAVRRFLNVMQGVDEFDLEIVDYSA